MKLLKVSWMCCGLGSVIALTACNVGRAAARVGDASKIAMMSQNLGPTMTKSTGDHMRTISAVIERDRRAFFDDLDMLYQTDRPSRLTRWHDR